MRGFDDRYFIPQSRHTAVDDDAIDSCKSLQVLSRSVENGINICATKDLRRIFVLGHFEYDRYTLADEYYRDKKKVCPLIFLDTISRKAIQLKSQCSNGVAMLICSI